MPSIRSECSSWLRMQILWDRGRNHIHNKHRNSRSAVSLSNKPPLLPSSWWTSEPSCPWRPSAAPWLASHTEQSRTLLGSCHEQTCCVWSNAAEEQISHHCQSSALWSEPVGAEQQILTPRLRLCFGAVTFLVTGWPLLRPTAIG